MQIESFDAALTLHFPNQCLVGVGTSQKYQSWGSGCFIDRLHVLTARHCWTENQRLGSFPIVITLGKGFRCEVVFESIPYDIIVLRLIERLDGSAVGTRLFNCPDFSLEPLHLGSPVGFISTLVLPEATKDAKCQFLAIAYVAMSIPADDVGSAKLFALSNTVIQRGFSGSAVFRPDGAIVGVLTESITFPSSPHNASSPIYTLPVVAPIASLIDQITSVIGK